MLASKNIRGVFIVLLVAAALGAPTPASATGRATSPVANVWTEPNSGYEFIDSAIASARRSIELSMYELRDTTIEHDLIARANAGVDVRVLLNAAHDGTEENSAAFSLLRASRVHVEWAPSGQIFHAKYLVIDSRAVYIGTGNLVASDYSSTRDFWVEDISPPDVVAVMHTFDSDFDHVGTTTQSRGPVWSPGSTSALVSLIDSSRRRVLVENEEMDSPSIESALESTARRGVDVKVVMTESSSWTTALDALARTGVHVRLLSASQVYIHAKVICVDCV